MAGNFTPVSGSQLGDIEQIFAASPSDLTTAGGLFIAPFGTELPEDVDEPLDPAFKNFGFVSDDGVSIKIDGSTQPIEVWGGDEIGALRDKFSIEYSMKLFQVLSPEISAALFGEDAVATAPASALQGNRMRVLMTNKLPPKCSLVLDAVFEDKLIRHVAEVAQLSDLGDITLVHNAPMAFEPTFRVFKGSNGVHVAQYSDDGQVEGS